MANIWIIPAIISLLGLLFFIFLIIWARKQISEHNGFRGTGKEARIENRL